MKGTLTMENNYKQMLRVELLNDDKEYLTICCDFISYDENADHYKASNLDSFPYAWALGIEVRIWRDNQRVTRQIETKWGQYSIQAIHGLEKLCRTIEKHFQKLSDNGEFVSNNAAWLVCEYARALKLKNVVRMGKSASVVYSLPRAFAELSETIRHMAKPL